jgi:glycerate kinase
MKLILAPDSFKESMSARTAAGALERGVRSALPHVRTVLLPIADGGEGTLDALVAATSGRILRASVTGPLGEPVQARYGFLGDGETAVVEMAEASGLHLVPKGRRDPRVTTTRGTGELVRNALDAGARALIVAIGGSATNDAGAGALQALGAKLLDEAGGPIGPGGGSLASLSRIAFDGLDPRLASTRIRVACDVTNTLCGPSGASAVFGPQKGATPKMVADLDAGLRRFAEILRRDTGKDVLEVPGGGAAGGLGAALVACGGSLVPGIDLVLDAVGFDTHLEGTDLVLTGEGRVDGQTPGGKVIAGLVARAARAGVPVVAFAGSLVPGYEPLLERGLTAVFPILSGPSSLEEALAGGEANLERAARAVARLLGRFISSPS